MAIVVPTRRFERELAFADPARPAVVAGMDEVGRGALAGPVSVGIVVSDLAGRVPTGLRDSKLLPAARRTALTAPIRRWARACAVGHAEPAEIDQIGIIAALALAARRALSQIRHAGVTPDVLLLDGNHDWFTRQVDLFDILAGPADEQPGPGSAGGGIAVEWAQPRVVTRIKADLACTGVAAASILAKVERDSIMTRAHEGDSRFGWHENKGYSSAGHIAALAQHGPSAWHRRSWRLPGTAAGGVAPEEELELAEQAGPRGMMVS